MGKLQNYIDALNWHSNGVSIYVWSAQGQSLKDLTAKKIELMEQTPSYAKKAIAMWEKRKHIEGARAFDCSGLVGYLGWVVGAIPNGLDKTAEGWKNNCRRLLNKSELRAGDWVFKTSNGKAYHIGVVVDDALNVVEAAGRDLGVVKRPLSANGWNYYGRPKYFEDEIGKTQVTVDTAKPVKWSLSRNIKLTTPYTRGVDVMNIQKALITNSILVGNTGADGVYGKDTKAAVIKFQKLKGLTADGIVGKNTCEALGGSWK